MNDIAMESDGLQLGELQQQLTEKEELIAALTAQLEQAADELDRRHRTGFDRGLTVGGGGLPPDLIEQQKSIADELQAAVQRWEDMQAALTLGRLEMQLTEIRDLITSQPMAPARAAETASPPRASETIKPLAPAKETGSGWESIKSRFLDESDSGEVESSHSSSERGAENESALDAGNSALHAEDVSMRLDAYGDGKQTVDVPMQEWDVEIPAPVEVDTADIGTLRSAVEARDKFIVEMTRRLRSLPVHMPPRDWEGLTAVPEELQRQLEDVLTRYDEKLRCAEIELSLERARLGRDEARLLELKELLEKQQKRLGIASGHSASQTDGFDDAPDGGKSSLWRRLSKK